MFLRVILTSSTKMISRSSMRSSSKLAATMSRCWRHLCHNQYIHTAVSRSTSMPSMREVISRRDYRLHNMALVGITLQDHKVRFHYLAFYICTKAHRIAHTPVSDCPSKRTTTLHLRIPTTSTNTISTHQSSTQPATHNFLRSL